MQRLKHVTLPVIAAAAAAGLVAWTALGPLAQSAGNSDAAPTIESPLAGGLDPVVAEVNRLFEDRWAQPGLVPAVPADELQVLRRLSLALAGTIPSLEEVRAFEVDRRPDRLRRWTLRLLDDRRFGEHFAERLAVAFVGNRPQDPPWFGRYRFEAWLAEQLLAGRPYDEIVHEMIAADGPPTTRPAADFVTAEIVEGQTSANRLAARSVRAFLGQRIDCAECHDHPFDDWTQADFQGLAAYFAQVRTASTGIMDDRDRRHEVEDRETFDRRVVEARVPFHDEWLSDGDTRRRQLADWITHDQNRRFLRAIANRVWGLMFGRPFIAPVDSIPDPPQSAAGAGSRDTDETELLDVLAADLRHHGGDLRRLVLVIASSRPFQIGSTHPELAAAGGDALAREWAVFPLVQLRPEQLSRSLQQAASIRPLSPDENVIGRIRREIWVRKFVEEYGPLGENEFDERTATIPQTVHRMHGQATREKSRAQSSSAAGRIAAMAPDDLACLETCYLVCLARRPTREEQEHFLPQLRGAGRGDRPRVVEDIFWTLFNSPEFAWNH
jgi:hypothetical protein